MRCREAHRPTPRPPRPGHRGEERHHEVYLAGKCAQLLSSADQAGSLTQGRRIAEKALAISPACPIPEIAQPGRTFNQWHPALRAHFDTDRANNGGEAVTGLIEFHRRIARGFRNRDDYRLRMLLIGGGLTSPT